MTNRTGRHWWWAPGAVVLVVAAGCGGGDAGIGQGVSGTTPSSRSGGATKTTRSQPAPSTTLGPGGQSDVAQVQTQLDELGCDAGVVDGAQGPGTAAAIQRFQTAAGLTVDGVLGPMTAERLAQAAASGSPTCAGGSARLTSTPPTTAESTPDCTEPALRSTAERYLGAAAFEAMTASQCSGDWAYVFARLQGGQSATDAGFETTLVMRWDGVANRWNVIDRSSACRGHKVPEDIREPACATN